MIIVGKDYDLKLCDFGLSAKFLNNNYERKKLKRQIGTECYCAPEILEGKEYDGDKVDIFSIGAVLLYKFNFLQLIIYFILKYI